MLSTSGIQAALETARTGSFTEASERLGLSASATSKALSRLEEELGVKLFHRTTRSLSLSGDGERFLARAEAILQQLAELEEDFGESGSELRGDLRLSLPHGLGTEALAAPLAEFMTEHQSVTLDVRYDNRILDLAEESIDVAVRTGRNQDSTSVVVTKFFEYSVALCASPGLLRRAGYPTKIEDLRSFPILRFRLPGRGAAFPFTVSLGEKSQTLEGGHFFEDLKAMAIAAESGAGLALLPTWSCLDKLESGALVELFGESRREPTPVWLAYHDRRYKRPKVQAFITHMKSRGAELTKRFRLP
jgi:DNA-binding transcriptional LysR family regulator